MYFLTEKCLLRLLAGSDINGDSRVDGADLSLLYSNWSSSGLGDLTGDGLVDGADLGTIFGGWTEDTREGTSVPEPVVTAGHLLLLVVLRYGPSLRPPQPSRAIVS